jgi:hypothetical protein
MQQQTESPASGPLRSALFAVVLLACIFVPWVLHFTVAWWAGPPSWLALAYLYDRLFVPKGSLCIGMPFMLALGSFIALLVWDVVLLAKWGLPLL